MSYISMNDEIEQYILFMKNLEKFIFCMNSEWENIIKRYDLTLSSYPFFEYISNNPGATQQEMACFFEVNKAVSSRACRHLENKKLIKRKVNSSYSHGYGCYFTEKGKNIYREIKKEGQEGFVKIFGDVNTADLQSVSETISRLHKKINGKGEE